ncbi:hypothetical protein PMI34_03767, partial [Pseudomonas sp. GM74]
MSDRRTVPLGGEAVAKPAYIIYLKKSGGRYAAQREQAPSPQNLQWLPLRQ